MWNFRSRARGWKRLTCIYARENVEHLFNCDCCLIPRVHNPPECATPIQLCIGSWSSGIGSSDVMRTLHTSARPVSRQGTIVFDPRVPATPRVPLRCVRYYDAKIRFRSTKTLCRAGSGVAHSGGLCTLADTSMPFMGLNDFLSWQTCLMRNDHHETRIFCTCISVVKYMYLYYRPALSSRVCVCARVCLHRHAFQIATMSQPVTCHRRRWVLLACLHIMHWQLRLRHHWQQHQHTSMALSLIRSILSLVSRHICSSTAMSLTAVCRPAWCQCSHCWSLAHRIDIMSLRPSLVTAWPIGLIASCHCGHC